MSTDHDFEIVGYQDYHGHQIPIFREKRVVTMSSQTDTIALLTKLVNELKDENEMLKSEIFKKQFESSNSSFEKQRDDIEAGKVVPR